MAGTLGTPGAAARVARADAERGANGSGSEQSASSSSSSSAGNTTPSTTPVESGPDPTLRVTTRGGEPLRKSVHDVNVVVSPTFLQTPRMDAHLERVIGVDETGMDIDDRLAETMPDANAVDIQQVDGDISRLLKRLEVWEQVMKGGSDDERVQMTRGEMQTLLDAVKSTLLRVNLKNVLARNEISTNAEENAMERYILIRQLEDLQTTLRVIQTENEKVTEKNLKLIKYVKTLKLEKLQTCLAENRQLRERVRRLEQELARSPGQTAAETAVETPQSTHMLDALGRLASEYLSHEQ